ncbi:hypothetical protein [Shinella sp. JR1-6]|uniref:hypothetical protein n=1 Tax=Shinella sp. JR1-6 TaxID=2527671 RepID=UPI00102D4B88|nr:hypothetical protein [Shinella sp. JR1-6]TAA53901.1 hypothetical protein EXZ48_28020 [Shinella sp. JR1-6]
MIPSIFSDIAPKALLASLTVWAGANYVVIGPEVASRVARADYLPICEGNFKAMVAAAGEERASQVRMPKLDAMQEFAIGQARELYNSEWMDNLRAMSGGKDLFGFDKGARLALRQIEDAKRAAKAAYETAQARIKAETATTLGKAGDMCGCVADAAIADTRTDWAIYSGTLTFITPAGVKAFDQRMGQAFNAGACGLRGGA